MSRPQTSKTPRASVLLALDAADEEDSQREVTSREVQTVEEDDQSEWQRIWKHAFEKMRTELELRRARKYWYQRHHVIFAGDLTCCRLQELDAMVQGLTRKLEKMESDRNEEKQRHEAEINHLRSIHAIEIEQLKHKHRQQACAISLIGH